MHRNTFINSPKVLNATLQTRKRSNLFFAGQITGTEGYTESIATGMLAGINMARYLLCDGGLVNPPYDSVVGVETPGSENTAQTNPTSQQRYSIVPSAESQGAREQISLLELPKETMLGALCAYISDPAHEKFQPINSNWGIVTPIDLPTKERKNKKLKNELLAKRAIEILNNVNNSSLV
jgi:methylenetetrahydrofolate--tRNA-(uracil-5-)-methyltransferase